MAFDDRGVADNVYKFRRTKWAAPERLKMIAGVKPKRRRSPYVSGLVVLGVAIAAVAVQAWPKLVAPLSGTRSEAVASGVYVIDGDTVRLNDGGADVRLVGFNTPETGDRARCEAERQKGEAARRRLRELVSTGRVELQQVACSCPPGTEGTSACNYGRRCGTLRINGVDVGSLLVAENLAVRCTGTSCSSLRLPWC